MAAAVDEAAEAAGDWADKAPAIRAERRAAHRSAPAPRDPRETRVLQPFARPASRCRCRWTGTGDHERDLAEGQARVPGTAAGAPGTRSAWAEVSRAGTPRAGLLMASAPRTGDTPQEAPAALAPAAPAPAAPSPVPPDPAATALAVPSRGIPVQGAGVRNREATASGAVAAGSARRWRRPAPSPLPHHFGPSCAAENAR